MEAIPFKPFFIIQCAQSTAQTLLHTILLTCTVHTTMRNHTRAALNSGRESLGLERLLSLLALESRHSLAAHTNTILLSGYLELFVVQQIIIGLDECLGEWLRRWMHFAWLRPILISLNSRHQIAALSITVPKRDEARSTVNVLWVCFQLFVSWGSDKHAFDLFFLDQHSTLQQSSNIPCFWATQSMFFMLQVYFLFSVLHCSLGCECCCQWTAAVFICYIHWKGSLIKNAHLNIFDTVFMSVFYLRRRLERELDSSR